MESIGRVAVVGQHWWRGERTCLASLKDAKHVTYDDIIVRISQGEIAVTVVIFSLEAARDGVHVTVHTHERRAYYGIPISLPDGLAGLLEQISISTWYVIPRSTRCDLSEPSILPVSLTDRALIGTAPTRRVFASRS